LLASWSEISAHSTWIVAALITVIGLFIIGRTDTLRFSFTRMWAIAGVCFDESIRKRILLITPLAVVGVIAITQFQRAFDEQDAMRQSIKICIFATGLVVILTSLILACTNLPKEIESRVIFTIVTKPTTRLELILGKIIGFARVSAAVVLIMGLFTWGYMRLASGQKRQQITYRLSEGEMSDTERARLTEYQSTGLLTARKYWLADELGIFGAVPDPAAQTRVISNGAEEDCIVSYAVDRRNFFGPPQEDLEDWANSGIGQFGLVIRLNVTTQRTGKATDQTDSTPPLTQIGPFLSPQGATTQPGELLPPRVGFEILDDTRSSIINTNQFLEATTAAELFQKISDLLAKDGKLNESSNAGLTRLTKPATMPDGTTEQTAYAWLPPKTAIQIFNQPLINIRIIPASDKTNYLIGPRPLDLFVPKPVNGQLALEAPAVTAIPPLPGPDGAPEQLAFRGRIGIRLDQEIQGAVNGSGPVAAFLFRHAPTVDSGDATVQFQVNLDVQRSNSDVEAGNEDPTKLNLKVVDFANKKTTSIDPMPIENHRPAFFSVPASMISGGNFAIVLQCMNDTDTLGLTPDSLQMIQARDSFEFNLLKSLLVIWMMSVLVISLAILCSTFLSWPIAVVLTVLILMGHWGVDQLADASGPGLGPQLVSDFKLGDNDAPVAKVVSTSVEALTGGLTLLARALPDTSQFDAVGEIQQGVSIAPATILNALGVLVAFAIPASVLAYLVMRNKEVAP
jgi:ABC-type transport system involved in multi-copper enzyme maturation permease subunit